MSILITNIQRFSLHDGPGIRTTVFTKGCTLHCPWCSNPENLTPAIQNYVKKDKDGHVEETGTYGKWYSPERLYDEIVKDKIFYGDIETDSSLDFEALPGGVTFSGGECLAQIKELEPVLKRLNEEHIHTAVESCLFVPDEYLAIAIKRIDLFYVDLKIINEERCKKILGGNIEMYKSNLEKLLASKKPIVLRIPVIGGYTDDGENRKAIADIIRRCALFPNVLNVEILKEHNLGLNKYNSLVFGGNKISIPDYAGVSDELLLQYKNEIEEGLKEEGSEIPVKICKI